MLCPKCAEELPATPIEEDGILLYLCQNSGCRGYVSEIPNKRIEEEHQALGLPKDRLANKEYRSLLELFVLVDAVGKLVEPDISSSITKLSDSELCELIRGALAGGEIVAVTGNTSSNNSRFFSLVLSGLVAKEFDRRRSNVETRTGRLIRKWIVAQDDLSEIDIREITDACQFT